MADVDSSTGGALLPADAPAPAEDLDLDLLFQATIAAITGIDGSLVRPRWQPGNPKQPDPTVDWCAVGVTTSDPDANPAIEHISAGDGSARSIRHEALEVFATFYGPHGKANAGRLRDGLFIAQNREQLTALDIGFVAFGRAVRVPELVNQQWVARYDMRLDFRRKVVRIYQIRNLAGADIHLFDDTHVDRLIEVPPTS